MALAIAETLGTLTANAMSELGCGNVALTLAETVGALTVTFAFATGFGSEADALADTDGALTVNAVSAVTPALGAPPVVANVGVPKKLAGSL